MKYHYNAMSTIYGLAASLGQDYLLCTVNPLTGAWTPLGVPITLSPPAPLFVPVGLMWNPDTSIMYLTATDAINGPTTNLYILDLNTHVATFQVVIDQTTQISNGFIKGLSYDNVNNEVYCISVRDVNASLNTTYLLDLSTGDLTLLGSPPFDDATHSSTLFNGTDLFGLAVDESNSYQMYTVNIGDGTWTPTSSETGYVPVSEMISGDPRGDATTFDPSTNTAYGAITIDVEGVQVITTVIDLPSGAWLALGPTGIVNPQAMTVVETICVAGQTQVELANGQQKSISEIQEGDLVVDFKGRAVRVERNVMSGHASQFIRIPKSAFDASDDVLIRRGHPLLANGKFKVPCEALIGQNGVEEVQLDEMQSIFTLITERETFVQMNGIAVGTWSPESYRAAHQN